MLTHSCFLVKNSSLLMEEVEKRALEAVGPTRRAEEARERTRKAEDMMMGVRRRWR